MKFFSHFRLAATAIGLAAAAGVVSSCKDYLDVEPTALSTSEAVFSTQAGATSAVLGVYDLLSGDQTYGIRINLYFPYDTDEIIGSPGVSDAGRRGIHRYRALPTNSEITNPWNYLYQGVERANICIEQIPKSALYLAEPNDDTGPMHRLYGEALTLRAQLMYELVRNWGDVPAQFVPSVAGQDFNLPNADRNATLSKLIDDLATASAYVPWRSVAGTTERVTKGAVKGLRARLALARGGYSLHEFAMTREADYLNYYRIARQECADLMTPAARAQHTLNPSYLDIFKSINEQRAEAAGNEIMFQVGMSGASQYTDSKLGYWNGPRLNASPQYGTSAGATIIAPPYFYAFDSTDVRRDVTITAYTIESNNQQKATALTALTDGKWRREWHIPAVPINTQYLGYNWVLLRYADVLLMFAEAENELNGPTQAAQDALLEVRTRAYAGNRSRATAGLDMSSKSTFFNAVVNERYLEFGGEGIRKYDLLRWNLFATKIAEAKAKIAAMQAGATPFDKMPATMYYRVVNGQVVWASSFYKAPPVAPAGALTVGWRSSVNATYVANLSPAGTSVVVGGVATPSTGTGLAAEYVPGRGKELLPIPQTTRDTDPNLKQNAGY